METLQSTTTAKLAHETFVIAIMSFYFDRFGMDAVDAVRWMKAAG